MFGIGPVELMVVFVVALLVFGPKKLPELARTVGKGLAEFKRASNDLRRSIDLDLDHHQRPPPPGPAQAGSPQVAPEPGSPLDQMEAANAAAAAQRPKAPAALPDEARPAAAAERHAAPDDSAESFDSGPHESESHAGDALEGDQPEGGDGPSSESEPRRDKPSGD